MTDLQCTVTRAGARHTRVTDFKKLPPSRRYREQQQQTAYTLTQQNDRLTRRSPAGRVGSVRHDTSAYNQYNTGRAPCMLASTKLCSQPCASSQPQIEHLIVVRSSVTRSTSHCAHTHRHLSALPSLRRWAHATSGRRSRAVRGEAGPRWAPSAHGTRMRRAPTDPAAPSTCSSAFVAASRPQEARVHRGGQGCSRASGGRPPPTTLARILRVGVGVARAQHVGGARAEGGRRGASW